MCCAIVSSTKAFLDLYVLSSMTLRDLSRRRVLHDNRWDVLILFFHVEDWRSRVEVIRGRDSRSVPCIPSSLVLDKNVVVGLLISFP
jgi:hypothetical protein